MGGTWPRSWWTSPRSTDCTPRFRHRSRMRRSTCKPSLSRCAGCPPSGRAQRRTDSSRWCRTGWRPRRICRSSWRSYGPWSRQRTRITRRPWPPTSTCGRSDAVYGPDGGPRIPIKIQPTDFHDVAQQFVDAGSKIYQVLPTLFHVLGGFRGPAGIDESAKRFDSTYHPAVASVVDGVNRAVNLLGDIGLGIDMAARNHWNADAAATPNGAPPPPWSPVDTGLVLPQSLTVPSLVGSPSFVLPPPLSDMVPAGHVDDLQTVAQAFRAAHDKIDDVSTGLHNALEFLFSNNQSADLDALNQFWDHVGGNAGILGALRQACDQIATAVQDYANWTIDTQNQILDAVGNFLKNVALGALIGILIGTITDGIGALAAILTAADEVGGGGDRHPPGRDRRGSRRHRRSDDIGDQQHTHPEPRLHRPTVSHRQPSRGV